MRNKKRLAANIGGVIVVLLVLAYVGNRPGHIPMYDANLVRLAETERQGYCAGVVFWKTQGSGSPDQARACREEHPEESGRVNLLAAETGFCRAIVESGWEGYVGSCLVILSENQYWPTYDGGITAEWNRARPYPSTGLTGIGDESDGSRTGGRSGGSRSGGPDRSDYSYYGGTP